MKNNAQKVYNLILEKTTSNELMQGFSGVLGFPFTLIADAGVLFTHYGPMLNRIREIYGRSPVSAEVIVPIVRGCKTEMLADLVLDKFAGQIPLVGIGANIMCAKAMNWRLGILFAMLAARGEEISVDDVENCARMIRKFFPQSSMFRFTTPSPDLVEKLLNSVEDNSMADFNHKMSTILNSI